MDRIYDAVIEDHFQKDEQMLLFGGPRQVGKTTIALDARKNLDHFFYFNWDNQDHRKLIVQGAASVAEQAGLDRLTEQKSRIIFDEIHKYKHWKNFLKGFFDTYKNNTQIIVTGSSRLNVFRKGGDSLMGRYFPYQIYPLSVAECLTTVLNDQEIRPPARLSQEMFDALWNFGGFPEPFLKRDKRFSTRWKRLRAEQLIKEDIRDFSRIQDIHQLGILAELLKHQAGQLTNYNNLANKVNVSVDTIRRWMETLKSFYYCFTIQPWTKNVTRSLLKEPKVYLYDWSDLDDPGAKAENFVAVHLLKAVQFWSDQGLGHYGLYFLRDKEKREVDFLVVKNRKPWFLVEVKYANNSKLSRELAIFQKQIEAPHAFQAVFDMEFVDQDCFCHSSPIAVPIRTLLSQWV